MHVQTLEAKLVQLSNIYSKTKALQDGEAGESQNRKQAFQRGKQIHQSPIKQAEKSKRTVTKHTEG